MKDDPDINVKLVKIVKKYPCIYDSNHADFGNKLVQDKTWTKIGRELFEKGDECRQRWKRLRNCYVQFLKTMNTPSNTKLKKSHYLSGHFEFLLPFLKLPKVQSSEEKISNPPSIETEQTQAQKDHIVENIIDKVSPNFQNKETHISLSDIPLHNMIKPNDLKLFTPSHQKILLYKAALSKPFNKSLGYSTTDKKTNLEDDLLSTPDDPDLLFFQSIMPDVKEMTNNQKRRFKISVLKLVSNVLSDVDNRSSTTVSLKDDLANDSEYSNQSSLNEEYLREEEFKHHRDKNYGKEPVTILYPPKTQL